MDRKEEKIYNDNNQEIEVVDVNELVSMQETSLHSIACESEIGPIITLYYAELSAKWQIDNSFYMVRNLEGATNAVVIGIKYINQIRLDSKIITDLSKNYKNIKIPVEDDKFIILPNHLFSEILHYDFLKSLILYKPSKEYVSYTLTYGTMNLKEFLEILNVHVARQAQFVPGNRKVHDELFYFSEDLTFSEMADSQETVDPNEDELENLASNASQGRGALKAIKIYVFAGEIAQTMTRYVVASKPPIKYDSTSNVVHEFGKKSHMIINDDVNAEMSYQLLYGTNVTYFYATKPPIMSVRELPVREQINTSGETFEDDDISLFFDQLCLNQLE